MKKIIILTLAVLGLALQNVSAQTNEKGSETYRYYKALEILNEGGNPEEAREILVDNINEYPDHISSYLLCARIDRRAGAYGSALNILDSALRNNYKNSDVKDVTLLWWKGCIYMDMDEPHKALEIIKEVVNRGKKQDPANYPSMLESLGQVYYELEEYSEADKVYNEMLEINDAHLLPRVGLARNMIARKEFDKALTLLEECKKYDKNYPEIYRFQMIAYGGKGEYKKMIDSMIRLYETSEDIDDIYINNFMKDPRYSIALLKQKCKSETDRIVWEFSLATVYMRSRDYHTAIEVLENMANEYGRDVILHENIAKCFEELGLFELAVSEYNHAIECSDEESAIYYKDLRGNMYFEMGEYELAIKDADAVVETFPAIPDGYCSRWWYKDFSGDLDGAFEDINEALAMDDEFIAAYLFRGRHYLRMGKEEDAKADFELIIAKDTIPVNTSCRHYALHYLGEDEEAVIWIDQIIADNENDYGLWYDKACLLSLMGRCEEAVAALQTAFEKGYRGFAHIRNDRDMDNLKNRDDFKDLVKRYEDIHAETVARYSISKEEENISCISEVEMKKNYGGTYEIPCEVNGLPLRMIFDTGAADVTISAVEANFMLKNGYLCANDIKGKAQYQTASGDIHEGTVLRLKEVRLGDAILKNVEASVVHNQKAPLLLGQSVLENFGTITIDNVNSKLVIKQ